MNGEKIFKFLTRCNVTKAYFQSITSVHSLGCSLYNSKSKNVSILNTSLPGRFGHCLLIFAKPGSIVAFNSFGVREITPQPT